MAGAHRARGSDGCTHPAHNTKPAHVDTVAHGNSHDKARLKDGHAWPLQPSSDTHRFGNGCTCHCGGGCTRGNGRHKARRHVSRLNASYPEPPSSYGKARHCACLPKARHSDGYVGGGFCDGLDTRGTDLWRPGARNLAGTCRDKNSPSVAGVGVVISAPSSAQQGPVQTLASESWDTAELPQVPPVSEIWPTRSAEVPRIPRVIRVRRLVSERLTASLLCASVLLLIMIKGAATQGFASVAPSTTALVLSALGLIYATVVLTRWYITHPQRFQYRIRISPLALKFANVKTQRAAGSKTRWMQRLLICSLVSAAAATLDDKIRSGNAHIELQPGPHDFSGFRRQYYYAVFRCILSHGHACFAQPYDQDLSARL